MNRRLLTGLRIALFLTLVSGMAYRSLAQAPSFYLSLQWSNDILYLPNQTDYYFTNGMNLEFSVPAFSNNPLNYTLLNAGSGANTVYMLGLTQDIFTPVMKDTIALLLNDRPFASYLTLQSSAISTDPVRSFRIRSEWQLGIMGGPAGGAATQNLIHKIMPASLEVVGWVNQVRTDAVINYNVTIEKGLLQARYFQSWVGADARIGTLYTDMTPGVYFRLGIFDDYFNSPAGCEGKRKLNAFLYGRASLRMVAYDATLNGGIFRVDDRFRKTITPDPLQENWEVGMELSYRKFALRLGAQGKAPDFEGGRYHRWGYVGIRVLH